VWYDSDQFKAKIRQARDGDVLGVGNKTLQELAFVAKTFGFAFVLRVKRSGRNLKKNVENCFVMNSTRQAVILGSGCFKQSMSR